jgi:hypothetical protein
MTRYVRVSSCQPADVSCRRQKAGARSRVAKHRGHGNTGPFACWPWASPSATMTRSSGDNRERRGVGPSTAGAGTVCAAARRGVRRVGARVSMAFSRDGRLLGRASMTPAIEATGARPATASSNVPTCPRRMSIDRPQPRPGRTSCPADTETQGRRPSLEVRPRQGPSEASLLAFRRAQACQTVRLGRARMGGAR